MGTGMGVVTDQDLAGRPAGLQGSGVRCLFRGMTEADLPEVCAIERRAHMHPWSEGIFRDCLSAGYRCRLVLRRHTLLGYGIMATGAGEAHLLNLCVRPESRRQGLGRALLRHLLEQAIRDGVRTVLLEVRPSNAAAIALYAESGFAAIGRRRGYYPASEGREDAIVMALRIDAGRGPAG